MVELLFIQITYTDLHNPSKYVTLYQIHINSLSWVIYYASFLFDHKTHEVFVGSTTIY